MKRNKYLSVIVLRILMVFAMLMAMPAAVYASDYIYTTADYKVLDPSYYEYSYDSDGQVEDVLYPYTNSYAYSWVLDKENMTAELAGINDSCLKEKAGDAGYDLVIPAKLTISETANDEIFDDLSYWKGTYKVVKAGTFMNGSFKSVSFPDTDEPFVIDGGYAFQECQNLNAITIPGNISFSRDRAFQDCKNLKEVTLGEGFENIVSRMFLGCDSLENINLPQTLKSIGDQAFCDCSSLTKFNNSTECVLPDSVTRIEGEAFGNCGFSKITFPKNLGADDGSDSYWMNTANFFGGGFYLTCQNLESIDVAEGGKTDFYSRDGVLYFNDESGKERIVAYPVAKKTEKLTVSGNVIVSSGCFANDPYLKEITFAGDTEIEGSGLSGVCMKDMKTEGRYNYDKDYKESAALEKVSFKGNVTLYVSAFADLEKLKEISFAQGKKAELYNNCIDTCDALESFTFPESFEIKREDGFDGYGPFKDCEGLKKIVIYENTDVTKAPTLLDARCFEGCTSLTAFEIKAVSDFEKADDTGCSIDDKGVLFDSTGSVLAAWPTGLVMDSYTVPEKTSLIGEYAFYSVKGPKTFSTGEGADLEIGEHAFDQSALNLRTMDPLVDCNIKDVTLTARVKSIGKSSFYKCFNLEKLVIENGGITSLPSAAFAMCSALKNVSLADDITQITGTSNLTGTMDSAFNQCLSIEKLSLPSKLAVIEQRTFCGLEGLKEITIPASVTEIKEDAFFTCHSLEKAVIMNGSTEIASDAFSGVGSPTMGKSCTFYVVEGSPVETWFKKAIEDAENEYTQYELSYMEIDWKVRHIGKLQVSFIDYMSQTSENGVVWEGSVSENHALKEVLPNGKLPSQGSADSEYFEFKGWFTDASQTGGEKIQADPELVAVNDMTFYAEYENKQTDITHHIHTPAEKWESNELYHWHLCVDNDGAILDKAEHIYDGGTYKYSDKYRTFTCKYCGHEIHEVSDGQVVVTPTSAPTSVPTSTPGAGAKPGQNDAAVSEYKVSDTGNGKELTAVYSEGENASGKVVIRETVVINGIPCTVTGIEKGAFEGNSKVTEVVLPETVENIGDNAFKDSGIKKITIPASVKTIGKNAFSGCGDLVKVTVKGNGITAIKDGAFSGCVKMKSFTVPSSVKTIGKNAFKGNKKLKKIKINGNKLKKVGRGAFSGIKKNAKITITAKDKKTFDSAAGKIKKSGASNVKYLKK